MPHQALFSALQRIKPLTPARRIGRVVGLRGRLLEVSGLNDLAEIGAEVEVLSLPQPIRAGVLGISKGVLQVLSDADPKGVRLGTRVIYHGRFAISPDESWLGRIIGPLGESLDGLPLKPGPQEYNVRSSPIPATARDGFGERLASGLAVFDTFLPIVEGQRIGLFSGSGVGKSTLVGQLATELETDVAIVALIGERGREVMEFARTKISEAGRQKTIVVAATSDRSPGEKYRAAELAVTLAEWFRDRGKSVLFICDSVTRFAEAHRDIAVFAGERTGPSGFPPSTSAAIMALAERTGPGRQGNTGITGLFTVLAEGSDMDGYVPDIVRGVLDGHVVLEREIAEAGRFPAINLRRSVSRALPEAASREENEILGKARKLAADYDSAALMIKSGLYEAGADPDIDRAIRAHPLLEAFLTSSSTAGFPAAFQHLASILAEVGVE